MTNVLHLQAQVDSPIACDMSTASDTPGERLAAYHRLFERALQGRERRDSAVVFSFRADPRTREAVEDLARREAACCPFLDYRVETLGGEVRWTVTNPITADARTSVDVILDTLFALPDHAGSDIAGYFSRLADGDVRVEADGGRFELRDPTAA
jgi:hypothetical protein